LAIYGIAGVVAGFAWGYLFPLNKPLWTSSYVLYAAGWALLVLGLLIWIIDLKGYTKWTSFFVVFGMNPLFIFALSGLYVKSITRFIHVTEADGTVVNAYTWLYQHVFVPLKKKKKIASLLFALAHIVMYWLIGLFLYRKKIFIKV